MTACLLRLHLTLISLFGLPDTVHYFPHLLLISLTAFALCVEQLRPLGAPAFTWFVNLQYDWKRSGWRPSLLRVMALAWGVLLAGALQLFFQFLSMRIDCCRVPGWTMAMKA